MNIQAENAADASVRLRGAETSEPRILIVEDDLELMNVIVRLAERLDASIQVDWATDVDGALERIRRHRYALILADYYLKGSKCGLTLMDVCLERQPDAVFAMMSSMSFEDLWALPAAREVPLLRKPFSTEECLGFLGSALR